MIPFGPQRRSHRSPHQTMGVEMNGLPSVFLDGPIISILSGAVITFNLDHVILGTEAGNDAQGTGSTIIVTSCLSHPQSDNDHLSSKETQYQL